MKCLAWLFVLLVGSGLARAQEADRPNVLFIVIDDLNDWVAPLGTYPGVETPNIDRLAARGVSFTRAYAQAPECAPSRASFLSGRYPVSTGLLNNLQEDFRALQPEAVILPQYFKQQGYYVAGAGKLLHLYAEREPWWDDYLPPVSTKTPAPPFVPYSGVSIPDFSLLDWGPVDAPDTRFNDYTMAAHIAAQLRVQHDRPFMLMLGITRPHLPWFAPRTYFDRYPLDHITLPSVPDNDLDDLPVRGRDIAKAYQHDAMVQAGKWTEAVQAYLASITFADAQVGLVLDALEASPYANNTIVVLTSDHGMHLGEKHHWHKYTLWNEATRIPLIISLPGGRQGVSSGKPVGLIDLYPTLLDLTDLPPKSDNEGHSLRPLLEQPGAPWPYYTLTSYRQHKNLNVHFALQTERWRYIQYNDDAAGLIEGEELYDHDMDPKEWDNLAGKPAFASIRASLASALRATLLGKDPIELPTPPALLAQNYPNPFISETTIRYFVPENTRVILTVYDLLGRTVTRLIDTVHLPGSYETIFEHKNLASGTYICRLEVGRHTDTMRMTLAR